MNATEAELALGNSYEERRAALEDTSRFDYDKETGLYISKDKQHKFDPDGEEVLDSKNDETFSDIRLRVLRQKYGYYKAMEMLEAEKKGGSK